MKPRMWIAVAAVVLPLGAGLAFLLSANGDPPSAKAPRGDVAAEPQEDPEFLASFGEGAADQPVRQRAKAAPAKDVPTRRRVPVAFDGDDGEALLAALKTGQDERVLQQRVYDFASRENPKPGPLLALWKRARSPQLKETLLWALGLVEGSEALPALEKAAKEEPLATLRLAAARALLNSREPRARAALRQVLAADAAPQVRQQIATLLALRASDDEQTVSALSEVAQADEDANVRMAAAEALAVAPSQRTLAVLEGLAESARSGVEKTLAARLVKETRLKLDPNQDLTAAFAESVHPLAKDATPTDEDREAGQ